MKVLSSTTPRLQLLGVAAWQRPDGSLLTLGPERRHQLLALLGYEGDWVPRERLATLFWPGRQAPAARANLRKVLHELRALGIADLEDSAAGLRWQPDSDVGAFRLAWSQARWQAAADTGAGPLMPRLDEGPQERGFADWLRAERQQWHTRWREAVLRAAALGDAHHAWLLAERLLALDALDEDAMAVALRAGAALQQPDRTQALWQRHLQALRRDDGGRPAPALQALAEAGAAALQPLSPMLGRDGELESLCAMLTGARLVTVFGPAGVGKSRLARHTADAVAPRFGRGAVLVALEGALAPSELPTRVAAALGLTLGGTPDPVQSLAQALAPQSVLLVLDGFEAIIDAGPALLRLLAAAPGLCVLVTSRERLALDGEWLLPLQGLAAPAAGTSAAEALATPAAALFVARARAVNPSFEATACAAAVADICRRLDGLPLALELAASWLRLLPAAEVAAELARGGALLDEAGGDGLQPLFERSWSLLTAAEREAHTRLAVFHGGFSRVAAEQVAGVGLAMLGALMDKSMLDPSASGRLGMHLLLLHHARRKLAALPDADALKDRHSRWYLALTRQPGADLAQEHDNLLAAWQQALARKDAVAVREVLFTLPWAAMVRGRLDEASALLGEAAQALGRSEPAGAQLLALQAWTLLWQEQRVLAASLAQQALSTLRATGPASDVSDVPGTVMALRTLGHAARLDGRHAEAADHLAEGVTQAHAAGLPAIEAVMLDGLAMVLNLLGRHDDARSAVQGALTLNVAVGDAVQRMYNLYNLAQSHALAGEPAQALPWAEQALDTAQRIGHLYFVPYCCLALARVQLALQRPEQAAPQVQRARQLAADHQDGAALAGANEAAARVALAQGRADLAWQQVLAAAPVCLQRNNVEVGTALVLTAARVLAGSPAAQRWLQALRVLPVVPEPVRREAAAALAQTPASGAASPTPAPLPATLQALLAELIAHGGAARGETHPKRPLP